MEQTYRIKTVKFDEFRYVLMSDLNWVTDVETDISIKVELSKAKGFHYEHIFLVVVVVGLLTISPKYYKYHW